MNKKIFFLTLMLFIVLIPSVFLFAGELKIIHEKTFKTEIDKKLKIKTDGGDVYISTWDKQEVYVKISGNRKAYDKMKFRFDEGNDGVSIEGKRDSWFNWFSWGGVYVKYEIKIPAKYNTQISTAGGDIKLYDLNGRVEFSTSGGDIFLKNIDGFIHASTSGGDVIVEDNKGITELSTSGGDIHVKDFNGDLSVSTSGGDIELSGKNGKVHASTSGGDIHFAYSGVNKGIELNSTGGDIYVKVDPKFSANARLSTTGGEVTCDLPITSKGKISSSKLSGQINGGGEKLDCHTTGGDIKVSE